jgi:hypothetical protein
MKGFFQRRAFRPNVVIVIQSASIFFRRINNFALKFQNKIIKYYMETSSYPSLLNRLTKASSSRNGIPNFGNKHSNEKSTTMTNESLSYHIKNENRETVLKCIGVDDMGFIMRPPIGDSVDNSLFGKILIDPQGVEYKVKSIAMRQNILWLEIKDY